MKGKFYNDEETVSIEKRMTAFCKDLEKLSLKYDIAIYSNDGLRFYEEGDLISIDYDFDVEDRTLEFHVQVPDSG